MKRHARSYLILGIVFLAIGITLIMTNSGSRVMAYGDIVLAIVFFVFSKRAQKEPEDDKKDNKKVE